ncbi:MAG: geranylgeranylglycerol-phosphate geranylgeranyltransferase [Marinilabiliaceae bacterium]|nr:geranylgeranylglycerol-phosphate geranylgeranyltransferase [Marinilabiliaceae bacterium]
MIKYVCQLIRLPNVIFVAVFQILLRYGIILPQLANAGIEPALTTAQFILLVLATTALTASGNVINDYFDVNVDKINRPERVIVGNTLDRRTVLLIHVILTFLGVVCGFYIALRLHKELYAFVFIIVPVLLWFYSSLFKKHFLIGNLVVAILTAATAWIVASTEFAALVLHHGHNITSNAACETAWLYCNVYACFAFLMNAIREIVKDMEDAEGDAACGCRTLPVEMGYGRSKSIVMLLSTLLVICILTAFLNSSRLQSNEVLGWAFVAAIIVTITISNIITLHAQEPKQYHKASTLLKVAMGIGVATIILL